MTVEEPRFLFLDEVLRLHGMSLAQHGGSEGIRDLGLIESALASAQNTFLYGGGDLFEVAASYAYHLAESQAFIDGNKRTGVAAALVFLARNGSYVMPFPAEFHAAMLAIADKRMTKAELARLLRKLVVT